MPRGQAGQVETSLARSLSDPLECLISSIRYEYLREPISAG